jgi:hypothetical protein
MPAQYRALWSVPGGGTGYSVLHFTTAGSSGPAQQIATDVHDLFADLNGQIPDDVTVTFDSEVLDLSEAGVLTAVWPVTPPSSVPGVSTAVYARAQGARIDWSTDTIVAGRRLTGRTYIVPVRGTSFDTTGLLTSTDASSILDQANAFLTQTSSNRPLRVWSRTHGVSAVVGAASVPRQGAILRGRRD